MREFKFRAWDNHNKRMLQDVGYHPFITEQYTDYKPTENGAYLISPKFDNYVLMQYTGLKDKNGKEIYEGDILKVKGAYQERFIVEYSAPTYCLFDGDDGVLSSDSFGWDNWELSEVIGNIYENKELLDRK